MNKKNPSEESKKGTKAALRLKREVLRNLTNAELTIAVGGTEAVPFDKNKCPGLSQCDDSGL